jgi:DNA repair photolyase
MPTSEVRAAINEAAVPAMAISQLSNFERACALRAAAVNERLAAIDQLLAAGTPIGVEVDGEPRAE